MYLLRGSTQKLLIETRLINQHSATIEPRRQPMRLKNCVWKQTWTIQSTTSEVISSKVQKKHRA